MCSLAGVKTAVAALLWSGSQPFFFCPVSLLEVKAVCCVGWKLLSAGSLLPVISLPKRVTSSSRVGLPAPPTAV